MTKKSAARLEREQSVRDSNGGKKPSRKDQQRTVQWEELQILHVECSRLALQHSTVLPLLQSKDFVAAVKDPKELEQLARLLLKDVQEFTPRLQQIKARHEGRTGPVQSADENMELIMISEEYQQWIAEYSNVVLPTIQAILAMADEITPVETPVVEGKQ